MHGTEQAYDPGTLSRPAPTTTDRAQQVEPRPRRRRRLRIVVWIVVLAAVLGAAFVGVRAYAFSQWYVGNQDGRVTLFQGMPVVILGYELHRAAEVTDLSATRAMELRPWRQLDDGITAESEEEARSIIDTIRRDLAEAQRPPRSGGGG